MRQRLGGVFARAAASLASNSRSVSLAERSARVGQASAHRATLTLRAQRRPCGAPAPTISLAPSGAIDHAWIPMSDGTRLAARIWLPEDAEDDPVPAILEYLPYRKGDAIATRDSHHHPYFAGHGYAGVRVDLRGSGDSDGIMLDEYLPQEQDGRRSR